MRKNNLDYNNIKNILILLESETELNNIYLQSLKTFTIRGLASREQVQSISGLSEKSVRTALEKLVMNGALLTRKVNLYGHIGPPYVVYLLSSSGAEAINQFMPDERTHAPNPAGAVELAHAFAGMEVYTAAYNLNLTPKIEKEIEVRDDNHAVLTRIRPDVQAVLPSGQTALFEIEQSLTRSNLHRAVQKLANLAAFYQKGGDRLVSRKVRFLFNLPSDDRMTIPLWAEALGILINESKTQPDFEIYTHPLTTFLKHTDWESIGSFQLLQPIHSEKMVPELDRTEVNELPRPSSVPVEELHIVLRVLSKVQQEDFDAYINADNAEERSHRFFELMVLIYEASHYRYSPVEKYAAFPYESVWLLKRFLHAHQNKALFADLKEALGWAFGHDTGVINFRNAMTRVLWDVFLRYFGFSRGEALSVAFQAPDFDGRRSDYSVSVRIAGDGLRLDPTLSCSMYEKRIEERSLAWVLEALYLFAPELGLTEMPWLKRIKKRSRGKGE